MGCFLGNNSSMRAAFPILETRLCWTARRLYTVTLSIVADTDPLARAFTALQVGGSVDMPPQRPEGVQSEEVPQHWQPVQVAPRGYRSPKRIAQKGELPANGRCVLFSLRSATFGGFPGFSPCREQLSGWSQRRQGWFSFFFFLEADHPHTMQSLKRATIATPCTRVRPSASFEKSQLKQTKIRGNDRNGLCF